MLEEACTRVPLTTSSNPIQLSSISANLSEVHHYLLYLWCRYVAFWIVILGAKFSFTYFLQVKFSFQFPLFVSIDLCALKTKVCLLLCR